MKRTWNGKTGTSIAGRVLVVAEQDVAGRQRQVVHRAGRCRRPSAGRRCGRDPARSRARRSTGSRSSDHPLDPEADAVAGLKQRRRVARGIEEAHRRCCRSCSSRSGPAEADTPVCAAADRNGAARNAERPAPCGAAWRCAGPCRPGSNSRDGCRARRRDRSARCGSPRSHRRSRPV